MSDAQLASLAERAGLSVHWTDAHGRPQQLTPEVQRSVLEALGYPAQSPQQIDASLAALSERQRQAPPGPLITLDAGDAASLTGHVAAHAPFQLHYEDGERLDGHLDHDGALPPLQRHGYHRLLVGDLDLTLAVAPAACPSVAELSGRPRIWGLAAQLYGLRRPGDGGLGDTQALENLLHSAATKGADALAISPIHAMFAANPRNYSPYSPSSRLFFNALHAAPAQVLGDAGLRQAIDDCDLAGELARLEALDLVDWPAVTRARQRLLRQLFQRFCAHPGPLAADFARFREDGGDALLQHCRFEALHAHLLARQQLYDWRNWPEPYRDPAHAAVVQFAHEHAAEVVYHAFCQWLIARCLAHAQRSARNAGMRVGLIADLAVGADGAGSQAWSRQAELLPELSVGAPPDVLNRSGQNWGVTAFSPEGLARHGFRAYIEMLRANLAHAGGIRIDHIMGLKRLWVIPRGVPADAGAYLNYPLTDLLRLLALESTRHQALVIGEDLGTVPDGLRGELARRNILGMRVLLFEQQHGRFVAARDWPHDALATTTTHDLPSLRGWFAERDIHWREQAGHGSAEHHHADRHERAREIDALQIALREHGQPLETHPSHEARIDACIGFVADTPAPLVLLPLEDALGLGEQPNLPGPGDLHPNWRRRMPHPSAQLLEQPPAARRTALLDAACRAEGREHD
ncbi:4-alpha-glucanotransferase [Pseudomonas sp. UL073]|uniref:4-alpha-glucanotransferase n=1 Tax=Zestomonas insulae TaxID=2809017 RepID=A0ABS2IGK7_9GAMM|nr:4-alpha-glucanotransferase [Pseudomonas insulae]MBM7061890.1 4-alpha-glucanotransferase [Pseudomonas insulae]